MRDFLRKYWPALIVGLLFIGGGTVAFVATRGLRNNNPGNIRKGQIWQGMSDVQSDPDFVQFTNPYWGIRALAKTLKTYQQKYGINTVAKIVQRWAPPTENNTTAYIASVSTRAGFDPNTMIDLNNVNTLERITRAIIHHENGVQPYSDSKILQAVKAA